MLILLFTFIVLKPDNTSLGKEAEYISSNLLNIPALKDMDINLTDELALSNLDCEQLRQLLDTKNKNVAIFFEDGDGNIVPMYDTYCIGCPEINISGIPCGEPYFCTPETDAELCIRYGKECGLYTDLDNCGTLRTILDCGSCTLPETCEGGLPVIPNECG